MLFRTGHSLIRSFKGIKFSLNEPPIFLLISTLYTLYTTPENRPGKPSVYLQDKTVNGQDLYGCLQQTE